MVGPALNPLGHSACYMEMVLKIQPHFMHILQKFSMLMKTAPKHWKNKQNHVSKIVNGTQAGENFELNLAFLI